MKNALYKPSDKHPIMVKVKIIIIGKLAIVGIKSLPLQLQDQYVQKFSLGPLSQDFISVLSSPTLNSDKKRNLAQASLDNFFSPGSGSEPKRPKSLNTPEGSSSKAKGSSRKAGKLKKTPKGKGVGKGKKLKSQALGADAVGASTPKMNGPKTPQSFSVGKMEALKALNRAKKMKQMDLKRSVHKKETSKHVTEAEWHEMQQKVDAQVVTQSQFKKEERLQKLRRSHEIKRQERMRQRELMKPREDLLCEGSMVSVLFCA